MPLVIKVPIRAKLYSPQWGCRLPKLGVSFVYPASHASSRLPAVEQAGGSTEVGTQGKQYESRSAEL